MSSWHSPQSIYNLGHRAIRDLFTVPVQIQEKVDGSFFAFGLYPELAPEPIDSNGGYTLEPTGDLSLKIRSKGAVMTPEAPMAMFKRATDTVKGIQHLLTPGWMYRGECLDKPKHNALAYDRAPDGNVILFDILRDEEDYLSYEELKAEGDRLGLEVVPQLFSGMVGSPDELRSYLSTVSVLGGQKIEGVVIKPLTPLYGPDKKMLFGKFVSEAFKEVHRQAWGESNPSTGDIIADLVKGLRTQARWDKSIQHMREKGLITDSPKDIGPLIKEIVTDVKSECEDEIKDALFKFAWKHIGRQLTGGFPEYYKQRLLEAQFEREAMSGISLDGVVPVDSGDLGPVAHDSGVVQ